MTYRFSKYASSLFAAFLVIMAALAAGAQNPDRLFGEYNANSGIRVDYGPWSDVLEMTVLAAGRSDRTYARPVSARLGSRINHSSSNPTRLEGNRVFYHVLQDEHLAFISGYRQTLEGIPSQASLSRFSRNEQLAYWLNLYTVTVYEQITRSYPVSNLNGLRDRVWDQKLLNVEGVSLSLRDIETRILTNWENPIVIYGLFQGTIGGPNIRTQAYAGDTVFEQLESNARDFVNSLRGVQFRDSTANVSKFYERNARFFPNFENDVLEHMIQYAIPSVAARLRTASSANASVYDWNIADLYNGRYGTGASSDNPAEFATGQSFGFGGGAGNPGVETGLNGVGFQRGPDNNRIRPPQAGVYQSNTQQGRNAAGNTMSRLAIPSGYPEHVRTFLAEIAERNRRMRDANVTVEEVGPDFTVASDEEDEGGN